MPCAPAGSPVAYKLGPIHYTPDVSVTQQPRIEVGMMDSVLGQVELPAFSDGPSAPRSRRSRRSTSRRPATRPSSGPAAEQRRADDRADDVLPRAGVAGHLTANVSARCDVASSVWKFSDGSVAYGEGPAKTFSKPGTVTGQLKVTDSSGLSATRDFSVYVSS